MATLISQTLAKLQKSPQLAAFAEQFLQAIPARSLTHSSPAQWTSFLEDRFSFFQTQLAKGVGYGQFDISTLDEDPNKKTLTVVCPDATYIVITLEALFKEFQFPITKLFHPIFSVSLVKGKIDQISRNAKNTELISMIYVEFEAAMEPATIKQFETRLALHLSSIQSSFKSQELISQRLSDAKKAIESNQFKSKEPQSEWASLLDWLRASNFSFYAYAAFDHQKTKIVEKESLGILSKDSFSREKTTLFSALQDHNLKRDASAEPFQFDTIPVKSPLQRFENLMRLSLKIPNDKEGFTEHIFLGLLRRSSLFVKNMETPIIHLKMKHIFQEKQMLPGSYDHTEVIRIFTSIPKFELFRTSSEDLLKMVEDLLSITNPNQVYCFSTSKSTRLSLLIVIPHSLFSKPNITLISDFLKSKIAHTGCEILEIRGDEKSRLHVHFETKSQVKVDCVDFENVIRDLIKPWEDSLKDTLLETYPGQQGALLCEKYAHGFPSHYKAIRSSAETVQDIEFLEKTLATGTVGLALAPFEFPGSALSGKASILSIYSKKKIDLMSVMPILQNLGLHVFDEMTTSVGPQKEAHGYIHSFRVVDEDRQKIDEPQYLALLSDMVKEIFAERALNDPLNRMILKSKLGWRQIQVLQTYRNYLLQLGGTQTKEKLNSALLNYPFCATLLINYFETKFSPLHFGGDAKSLEKRKAALAKVEKQFQECLHSVEDVSDDLALKSLFNVISATLRTNFFIRKPEDTFISVKLDSHAVRGMPLPVPYREIYVFDVGFEGIHLRFGAVARGGLRWSDRPDDFRTEVLSLVKTQQVKNVVIVPVGSKGGFVLKRKITSKEMAATESVKQYRLFISALLDITDNVNEGGVVQHPHEVVVHDNDDPYLVVAADKGTANFSDIANEVSESYNFWLGDAFASGGSVGYNHKKEAITARGAWECTKLHFKELGKDITKESITVAGIGDMSGDVFGNGMLLSKLLKLQAAFNHAHIFLDPNPNPETSWKERKRLFDLPRSSWLDYNAKLISQGGGIFERKAKEIFLTPEIQKLLDIKKECLTGEELIKAILKMQVDLMWFGGIGTYIKSSDETHSQVGDLANDAVRIDANECRALVMTEGANLGVTQKARMEFNRRNGHLNSDAIDNSAGVNMSDYEVNIKILLKRMLVDKQLKTMKERNTLLEKATDQVSELVLANNRGQHRLISMDVIRSEHQFQMFSNLIQTYVSRGIIDAKTENLPSTAELEHIGASRQSLSRPVLAVVQAYVKMEVYQHLVSQADLLEDDYLYSYYQSYFPKTFLDRFGDQIQKHHLKHEILATLLTNRIVNQAGTTFYFQCETITGKSVGEITKAYLMVEAMLGAQNLRTTLFNEAVNQESLYQALIKLEQVIQTVALALLQLPIPTAFAQIKDYEKTIATLRATFTTKDHKARLSYWTQLGYTESTAKALTLLGLMDCASDVIYLHHKEGLDIPAAISLSKTVTHVMNFDWLLIQLQALELSSKEEIELRNSAIAILQHKKSALLSRLITAGFVKQFGPKPEGLYSRELVKFLKETLAIHGLEGYLKKVSDLVHHNTATSLISLAVALNRLEI